MLKRKAIDGSLRSGGVKKKIPRHLAENCTLAAIDELNEEVEGLLDHTDKHLDKSDKGLTQKGKANGHTQKSIRPCVGSLPQMLFLRVGSPVNSAEYCVSGV
ncbi:hypothetical protein NDU88_000154 [Pleurodeles waltl]|uniref:Uncharacterized protein n=1 Tax=Pleurodeles waltl TaxID=8319 RepID=A0AAV7VVP5_PLEWA|nr:hypothetical protein NDU88_000154 [Pleurodeles waltl]